MAKKPRAKSPPVAEGPSFGPWARLAVTLLVPVAVMLLRRLGPTIVNNASEVWSAQRSSGTFSVFALGIMPFIAASGLVELVAAIVPRWAPLRHGGPEGRRKLWRATLLVALVLCLYQAGGLAQVASFAMDRPGVGSTLMAILTLTAGAFLLCFVAQLISAYGLSSGFGLLMVTSPVLDAVVFPVDDRGLRIDGRPPMDLMVLAFVAAASATVTWYALRPSARRPSDEPREPAYRAPPAPEQAPPLEIPVPASGYSPIIIAGSLLALPATFVNMGMPLGRLMPALHDNTVYVLNSLILITAISCGLSWVFNQPSRIAALHGGGRAAANIEAEARAALFPAMARTVLFCVVLFGLGQVARDLARSPFLGDSSSFALLTAVALDIMRELRARLSMPDLVPVRPEERPYAIAVVRDALRAAGIPFHARNEGLRRMLQFFGPYVPIELLVRRADAKRAAKVLSKALSPEGKEEKAEGVAARPRPAARSEARVTAVIALGVMALIMVRPWALHPPQKPRAHTKASTLEITLVDDESDPFAACEQPLEGVSCQVENVPLGPGRTAPRHYARIVPREGETLQQARARLAAWAAHVAVPAGERVAFARVSEFDEDKEIFEMVGWRTYLLKGPAVVTGVDVANAYAVPGTARDPEKPSNARVMVALNAAGDARFAALTRENVKRRLAIVVDSTVESAPQILSEIAGGYVQITMGVGDPEKQLAEAQQLARALMGEER